MDPICGEGDGGGRATAAATTATVDVDKSRRDGTHGTPSAPPPGKRGVPKAYTIDDHPTKLWVNRWLAHTASNHLHGIPPPPPPPPPGSSACTIAADDDSGVEAAVGSGHTCLVLETGGLHTVRALLAAGVIRGAMDVVVPNPDPLEVEAMVAAEPDILALCGTSHTLISALAVGDAVECPWVSLDGCSATGSSSPPPSSSGADSANATLVTPAAVALGAIPARRRYVPSPFSFVWLDYCGTLASRAGRQRQTDLRQLIERGLLCRRSVLAVTLTSRGSQPWYKDELVDTVVLLIMGAVARTPGVVVGAIDCCSYRIEGPHPPMYTILARLQPSEDPPPRAPDADAVPHPSIGDIPSNLRYTAGWRCADGTPNAPRRAPCQLLLASERMAQAFALAVATWIGSSDNGCPPRRARVLTLESKLAPVAGAVLAQCGVECVSTVVVDADQAAIATAVLNQAATTHAAGAQQSPLARVHVESHDRRGLRNFLERNGDRLAVGQVDAVWLGYERGKPRPTRELVACDGWTDLNHLLSTGALACEAGHTAVIGVMINADRTKLCWEAADVDWIVAGVRASTARHGLDATPVYVARCTIGSAQVAVVFRVSRARVVSAGTGANSGAPRTTTLPPLRGTPPTVSNWEEYRGWDSSRPKVPTTASDKHRRAAGPCGAILAQAGSKTLVLHEPGFFSALPTILATLGSDVTVDCCTDGDAVQLAELSLRCAELPGVQAHIDPPESAAEADALVLLTEGGVAAFARSWGKLLDAWGESAARESVAAAGGSTPRNRVLAILVDCPKEGEVDALAARAGMIVVETHPIWCNSRQAVLGIAATLPLEETDCL